jgi:hypothetical protein
MIKDNDSGYVYVVKSGNYFKIGKTKSPKSRISSLQTGNPENIEPIYVIKCNNMSALETDLHRRFYNKRIRGEWYALNSEDLKHLGSLPGYRNSQHKKTRGYSIILKILFGLIYYPSLLVGMILLYRPWKEENPSNQFCALTGFWIIAFVTVLMIAQTAWT